jgi:hypothetical protein
MRLLCVLTILTLGLVNAPLRAQERALSMSELEQMNAEFLAPWEGPNGTKAVKCSPPDTYSAAMCADSERVVRNWKINIARAKTRLQAGGSVSNREDFRAEPKVAAAAGLPAVDGLRGLQGTNPVTPNPPPDWARLQAKEPLTKSRGCWTAETVCSSDDSKCIAENNSARARLPRCKGG